MHVFLGYAWLGSKNFGASYGVLKNPSLWPTNQITSDSCLKLKSFVSNIVRSKIDFQSSRSIQFKLFFLVCHSIESRTCEIFLYHFSLHLNCTLKQCTRSSSNIQEIICFCIRRIWGSTIYLFQFLKEDRNWNNIHIKRVFTYNFCFFFL